MRDWLRRNAELLGAIGAIATAFAAISALIVIPIQITEADRIQRDQTAREIYREFLNLTIQKPELAQADYCAMTDQNQRTAYGAYVEYLLYTAEQMVDSSDHWKVPMTGYLDDHKAYLCSPDGIGAQPDLGDLLDEMGISCTPQDRCG